MEKRVKKKKEPGLLLFLFLIWQSLLFSGQQTVSGQSNTFISTTPVQIESGAITGFISEKNPEIMVYKGIPYAAAPIGDLRWKAPQSI